MDRSDDGEDLAGRQKGERMDGASGSGSAAASSRDVMRCDVPSSGMSGHSWGEDTIPSLECPYSVWTLQRHRRNITSWEGGLENGQAGGPCARRKELRHRRKGDTWTP